MKSELEELYSMERNKQEILELADEIEQHFDSSLFGVQYTPDRKIRTLYTPIKLPIPPGLSPAFYVFVPKLSNVTSFEQFERDLTISHTLKTLPINNWSSAYAPQPPYSFTPPPDSTGITRNQAVFVLESLGLRHLNSKYFGDINELSSLYAESVQTTKYKYDKILKQFQNSPVLKAAYGIAVVRACYKKEAELISSEGFC